jgi:exopolyphosphatase/guanosine-5'-triphosphate,3'-diphosphate pyrophosphatase
MTTPVVIECGSNSLKAHYRTETSGIFQKVTFPWQLGREVYRTGRLSTETLTGARDAVRSLIDRGFERRALVAIATGALRDAENPGEFTTQLREEMGLEVRVISGREEASLLAHGYLKVRQDLPALLADIGGGSLELVQLTAERTVLRDSLPLGAIRVQYLGESEGQAWNRELVDSWIANSFEEASLVKAREVNGTGGTVKALSRVLGKQNMEVDEISRLIARMETEGPPADLSPERREVFLAGVLVLRKLLDHCGAAVLRYTKISIGRIFLDRLIQHLGASTSGKKRDALLMDMRITNIIYPQQ